MILGCGYEVIMKYKTIWRIQWEIDSLKDNCKLASIHKEIVSSLCNRMLIMEKLTIIHGKNQTYSCNKNVTIV